MATAKQGGSNVLHILAWFTGVVVSLVIGSSMTEKLLTLPWWLGGTSATGLAVTVLVGWIIVITTLISAILAIVRN